MELRPQVHSKIELGNEQNEEKKAIAPACFLGQNRGDECFEPLGLFFG